MLKFLDYLALHELLYQVHVSRSFKKYYTNVYVIFQLSSGSNSKISLASRFNSVFAVSDVCEFRRLSLISLIAASIFSSSILGA